MHLKCIPSENFYTKKVNVLKWTFNVLKDFMLEIRKIERKKEAVYHLLLIPLTNPFNVNFLG